MRKPEEKTAGIKTAETFCQLPRMSPMPNYGEARIIHEYDRGINKNENVVDFIERSIANHNHLFSSNYGAFFLGNPDKSLQYKDIWIS